MRNVILPLVLLAIFSSSALAVIAGSAHDLSSTNVASNPVITASNTDQTCVFCHTPHGAGSAGTAPLWNRTNDTSPTGTYGDPTGSMETAPVAADVAATDAVLCLSCHDGSVGSSLTNPPNGVVLAITENWTGSNANLGADMSNDHPIGMSYGDAQSTDGELLASPALPFFSQTLTGPGAKTDVMWCSTCHDVHGKDDGTGTSTDFPIFLNGSMTSSALCTTCHVK